LKFLIEGYTDAVTRKMTPVLKNQGVGSDPSLVDHVTVVIHSATTPFTALHSVTADLNLSGSVTAAIPLEYSGSSYYIAIQHRNALETWTAAPLLMGEGLTYDFTTSASQAYGANQKMIVPGTYAFYSGDINSDGYIDATDCALIVNDANLFAFGNLATDLNGDSYVDAFDGTFCDNNNMAAIMTITP
jgi:hypothetical protein